MLHLRKKVCEVAERVQAGTAGMVKAILQINYNCPEVIAEGEEEIINFNYCNYIVENRTMHVICSHQAILQ